MNILVLCSEYPPIGGGGGVGAKQYAEAWAAKGYAVTVLTSWSPGLSFRQRENGVDVIRVFTFGRKQRATATFVAMLSYVIFGFLYMVFRWTELRRHHVVNSHFSIPTGILGYCASRFLRLPHTLTIIGGDIYDPTKKSSPHRSRLLRLVNSFVINASDRVVAISGDTKRRAEQYYNIRRPIQVINYGFQPAGRQASGDKERARDAGTYHLVAVGRLVERKGFDFLIRSLAFLPSNVVLTLVGDGPLESSLKELATKCGVHDRVIFVGYKPRNEVPDYLQRANCFVLSSLHEGLGIVVQEAMQAGLPIVATDNGGQVDLVNEPRNGLLVPPADASALAHAIHTLYSDRSLGKSMGTNNELDIRQYYIATNCERYLTIFQELATVPAESAAISTGDESSVIVP